LNGRDTPSPLFVKYLESSTLREIPGKIQMSKNLDTKFFGTKNLGRSDLGSPEHRGLNHDRASLIAAQGQMSHTGAVEII
jgi:hypothetical protein